METTITGEVQIIEACLKTINKFTTFEVHNICNGEVNILTYGALDLLGIYTFIAIVFGLLAFFVVGLFKM